MNSKSFALLFSLFSTAIFASVNIPWSLDIKNGYRQDYFQWSLLTDTDSQQINYQEKYDKRNFGDTEIDIWTISRDLFCSFEGSFAWIGSGNLRQSYDILSFTTDSPLFNYKSIGYDIDVKVLGGIAIDLTPQRFSRVILLPKVGYAGYWKRIKRNDVSPVTYAISPLNGMTSSDVLSYLSLKSLRQEWYGPVLGGDILFYPNSNVKFRFSYLFHWLNLYHYSVDKIEKKDYLQSILSSDIYYTHKIKKDTVDSFGHSVKAQVSYELNPHFLLGFTAKYQYFTSIKDNIHKDTVITQVYPSNSTSTSFTKDKFTCRWWYLSYLIDFTYRF